jgi:hypothetical protein
LLLAALQKCYVLNFDKPLNINNGPHCNGMGATKPQTFILPYNQPNKPINYYNYYYYNKEVVQEEELIPNWPTKVKERP